MSELIRTSTRFTIIMSSLSGLDGNHATEDLGLPVRYHAANGPHPAFAANTLRTHNGSPQGFGFRS
jgi:hypothetical protein